MRETELGSSDDVVIGYHDTSERSEVEEVDVRTRINDVWSGSENLPKENGVTGNNRATRRDKIKTRSALMRGMHHSTTSLDLHEVVGSLVEEKCANFSFQHLSLRKMRPERKGEAHVNELPRVDGESDKSDDERSLNNRPGSQRSRSVKPVG